MNKSLGMLIVGNGLLSLARWCFFVTAFKFLEPEEASRFTHEMAFALAVVGPTFILFGGGLKHVVAAQQLRYEQFRYFFAERLRTGVLAIFAALGLVMVLQKPEFCLIVLAMSGLRFADAMSEIVYGQLQSTLNFHAIGLFKSFRAGLIICIAAAFGFCGLPMLQAVNMGAFASLGVFFCFELPYVRRVGHSEGSSQVGVIACPREAKKKYLALRTGFMPLSVAMAISAAGTSMPAIFLGVYGDEGLLSVYGTLFCVIGAQQLVFVSYGQYLLPKIARSWREGRAADVGLSISLASAKILLATFVMAVTAYLAADYILPEIFSSKFHGYGERLGLLLLSGGLVGLYATFGAALTAIGRLRAQLVVSGVYLAVNFFTLFLFRRHLSVEAVGFSLGAGAVAAAFAAWQVRLRWKIGEFKRSEKRNNAVDRQGEMKSRHGNRRQARVVLGRI